MLVIVTMMMMMMMKFSKSVQEVMLRRGWYGVGYYSADKPVHRVKYSTAAECWRHCFASQTPPPLQPANS